jgi:hypothetical protein
MIWVFMEHMKLISSQENNNKNMKNKTKVTAKLDVYAGDSFDEVAQLAKSKTTDRVNIKFEFNGVTCVVSKNTNLEFLFRDYKNALSMEWNTVGPTCRKNYSKKIESDINKKKEEREIELEEQRLEYNKKEEAKKTTLQEKISGVELEIVNADKMNSYKSKNTDPYGGRCVSYAIEWGKLMQFEMSQGKKLKDIADETSRICDYDGITGFMYGAAVSILVQTWKYGEELRKWHNKEYDYDGEGTVNPAIITI